MKDSVTSHTWCDWGMNSRNIAPKSLCKPTSKTMEICIRRRPSTGKLRAMRITHVIIKFPRTYFPPTPKPVQATNAARVVKLFAPPAATPKTPAINKVMLNDRRRPIKSARMPHVLAPKMRPTYRERVVNSTLTGWSSNWIWGRMIATPWSQISEK